MVQTIKDVKMKHMHRLSDEEIMGYAKVLSFLKPSERLGRRKAKNIFEMEFGDVEFMKREIYDPEGLFKCISMVFDCPEKYLMDYRLTQFYGAYNHIKKTLMHIATIEENNLSKAPKRDMVDAGISRLDRFGPLNTLDSLAKDYGKSPEEIEKWSYNLVYHLMWKRKIESDIQDDYDEIMKEKNKHR